MNIFLPEKDILLSVQALDDSRLKKQILECEQMLKVSLGFSRGYQWHPVVLHYKNYPYFIARYACLACNEYRFRAEKNYPLEDFFYNLFSVLEATKCPKPFYCEGAKTDPNCIRTTENTVELFRAKLCKKWDNDKRAPKWTNRQPPEWYHSNRT